MQENLALYTFGVFVQPADHAANEGFYALNDPILDLVDTAPGLVARSGYVGDPGPASLPDSHILSDPVTELD